MPYTLRLRGVIVGRSDLEDADPSRDRARGIARGRFRPSIGYDLVQPIFQLYAEAVPTPGGAVADDAKLERFTRARDALGLELVDATGRAAGTRSILVLDYGDGAPALVVEWGT